MKKSFLFRCLMAAAVLAFAACTEKQTVNPEDDTPPTPQHNSLYQTTWAGTAQQTVTLPLIGDVPITIDNTLVFHDDSTATTKLHALASSVILDVDRDTTVACTYTWADPQGVLTAVENPQMNLAFRKVNSNTINITVTKSDLTVMWPILDVVSSYLPESFSIDLVKQ